MSPSLVAALAGAHVTVLPRLGGIEPIRDYSAMPRCHAGAGHPGAGSDRGSRGMLCDDCDASLTRLLNLLFRKAP